MSKIYTISNISKNIWSRAWLTTRSRATLTESCTIVPSFFVCPSNHRSTRPTFGTLFLASCNHKQGLNKLIREKYVHIIHKKEILTYQNLFYLSITISATHIGIRIASRRFTIFLADFNKLVWCTQRNELIPLLLSNDVA